ncbi:MAG: hypothetical protein Sapg2KO_32370 [Saprospiraceae bacterium]
MSDTSISLPLAPRPFWDAFFSLSPWLSFVLACVISGLLVFFQQEVLLTEALFYNSFGEQMAYERIEEMIAQQQSFRWLSYALIPVFLVVQLFLISLCLNVGTILYEYKIGFKKLFGMMAQASVWLALVGVLQLLPLYFSDIQTLDQMGRIDWFSLAALFSEANLPLWLLLPLKLLSLLTVFTLLLLAGGMHYLTGHPYHKMLGFVTLTYGLGMILLVLLLVFLQLNMS